MNPTTYVSHSKPERIFFKYFYKLYLWAPLTISVMVYVGILTNDITNDFFVLSILILASVLFCFSIYTIHKRLAYKIVIDFKDNNIIFHMLMDNEIVLMHFEDIIKVEVSQYLHFYSNNRKISFSCGIKSNKVKMINKLEEIFYLKTGVLGDIAKIWRWK